MREIISAQTAKKTIKNKGIKYFLIVLMHISPIRNEIIENPTEKYSTQFKIELFIHKKDG